MYGGPNLGGPIISWHSHSMTMSNNDYNINPFKEIGELDCISGHEN